MKRYKSLGNAVGFLSEVIRSYLTVQQHVHLKTENVRGSSYSARVNKSAVQLDRGPKN